MRYLLSLGMMLAMTLPSLAQDDKAKPNTLTPKEIADGWILLFDGETTFGWQGDGLKVVDGALVLPGVGTIQTVISLTSVHLEFDYKLSDDQPASIGFQKSDGTVTWFGKLPKTGTWSHAEGSGSAKSGSLTVDGKSLRGFATQTDVNPPGKVCFGGNLILRSVKLRLPRGKALFNGKDLTGWKEFPGKKSKITVTDKGEINIQNGPGDLQTTGKYKNFILQIECISNGKHLNSGIFFRCRDNEYQNGYEAQILNKFTAAPTQEYTIEEYDPKTNKLLEKKKIKATAVDYGTGAIYRRQPARKEMSKDGEWFAMTIIAHGNHLATWVNGVQVTDWTDNRPTSDNARNGCKLEAGHISIQGHDPTTNLSFRNLRIVELP